MESQSLTHMKKKGAIVNQGINRPYLPLYQSNKRYFILMGGRSAGRSFSASQYALSRLLDGKYFRCAIMRFVLGDVRNSIFQEIVDRAEEQRVDELVHVRDHALTITYGDNKINGIGFRKSSGDQKSKLKSLANYNVVIIEEADEINEEDFIKLDDSLRTIKSDIKIIFMLNPPHKNHWIIKRWFNLVKSGIEGFYKPELKEIYKGDTEFIHTTYRINAKNMNQSTKENFVRYKKTNPDHYYNMVEGLVSEGARGRIFKDWKIISDKEFEELEYPSYYSLDFGFTNDPTAVVEIKEHNDRVYVRELIYETGLTNPMIARRFEDLGIDPSAIIYGDSAEPKSIQELVNLGYNVQGAIKGPDSIRAGLNVLLSKEVLYTESSTNIDKENQEYKWALDKNKEPTNKPADGFDHGMDAIRYGVFTKGKEAFIGFA
jgi:phage terminase large subunit